MLFRNHEHVVMPTYALEEELRKIAKIQGKTSHDEIRFAHTFFYEVYDEYLTHKVEPDIAFIRIFKKWCGRYGTQAHIMEELYVYSTPIIHYLVSLSQRDDETWTQAIQNHVVEQICAITGNTTILSLTK